jgi:hypothetical protein
MPEETNIDLFSSETVAIRRKACISLVHISQECPKLLLVSTIFILPELKYFIAISSHNIYSIGYFIQRRKDIIF